MRAVVVGGSVAGVAACESLRRAGYRGELVLIGAENAAPYDRPPLSKQLLVGEFGRDDILLRDPTALGAVVRLGTEATALDLERRSVTLDTGEELAFDGLIIATGARPRRLAGEPQAAGVQLLRTLDDALALRKRLLGAPSVVVVGAGFIGLEVASSARALGCGVTVLEAAPHPMGKVFPAEVGEVFARLHRREGVEVRCGAPLDEIVLDGECVSGARLTDGTTVPCDLAVIGVGAVPNVEWLKDSGVPVADGVVCDATLRAADRVYACGDVARWPHQLYGSIRLEHWTTAIEHARTAGANLAAELLGRSGAKAVADAIPYFWSDQYGLKFQLVGVATGADRIHALADGERCAVLFGRRGRLIAAMSANWPRLVALYRRRIAARDSFAEAVLALPEPERPASARLSDLLQRLDTKSTL